MRLFSIVVTLLILLLPSDPSFLSAQEKENGRNQNDTGSYHDRNTVQRDSMHEWERGRQRMHDRHDRRSQEDQSLVRCMDVNCKYFSQMVPVGHQHCYKDVDINCKYFGQYVPHRHQHWHRCLDIACKYFNQFVPPGHRHVH